MKTFSTTNMPIKDKMHLMGNLLGSFGNENIRGHHIKHFEDNVLEYKENEKEDIVSTPNYYAWLSLMTEHIFWLIRNFCFKQTQLEDGNLALVYNKLVTKFCDIIKDLGVFSEPELLNIHGVLIKILEIRHTIIHKGFPNLLPVMLKASSLRSKPALTAGATQEKFNELTTKEIIAWYSNPRHFELIKAEFQLMIDTMSKCPGISVGF